MLLLRTQINGTCCNAGFRRFLPFSPLLTPTHPLNSSVVLTNSSNDQVALPGRGKMAGLVPHHTMAAFFTPRSGVLCRSHRRDSSEQSGDIFSGRTWLLWTHSPLSSVSVGVGGEVRYKGKWRGSWTCVLVELDFAVPGGGQTHKLQLGPGLPELPLAAQSPFFLFL